MQEQPDTILVLCVVQDDEFHACSQVPDERLNEPSEEEGNKLYLQALSRSRLAIHESDLRSSCTCSHYRVTSLQQVASTPLRYG